MGRTKFKRGNAKFVQVHHWLMDTQAWLDLKPSAVVVYLSLKRQFDGTNNGQIAASQRVLAMRTGLSRDTVQRALQELEAAGFLVVTQRGFLGVEGAGKATMYRLTELATADGKPATKDFLKK
ncbi:helix-turn-helix domain-containing protein [uncultured Tateyamaria sp.]|uniref:helix-turn-helix domain-containing protein n=1 Tax=uncultured Tateyamaria sp. TaxID=455651 RepID=UPI002622D408|nr:helix-turn-helix domain-containing protein [uncultured Tateyamaria sp.]